MFAISQCAVNVSGVEFGTNGIFKLITKRADKVVRSKLFRSHFECVKLNFDEISERHEMSPLIVSRAAQHARLIIISHADECQHHVNDTRCGAAGAKLIVILSEKSCKLLLMLRTMLVVIKPTHNHYTVDSLITSY